MLWFYIISIILSTCYCLSVNNDRSIPDEKWGYVTVRQNAHMFWWLYGAQNDLGREDSPLVLWLQGGPGGSGTGFGNFGEIGPLDENLKVRNTSWVRKANVLFIDNPVGTGFSYVTDKNAYTRNVAQIADDLLFLFSRFLETFPVFKNIPFYIFCESYGGKMTAVFGETLHKAIQAKQIECNFKGVALGDSWISPVDSILTWGPFLYYYNLLDDKDLQSVNAVAHEAAAAVAEGQYKNATNLFLQTQTVIARTTDNVNVYNVLQHDASPVPKTSNAMANLYNRNVAIYHADKLTELMNGLIREKLKIIPDDVKWGAQSDDVVEYQSGDFMKPVIESVDYLIKNGLKVAVYQGQLDMICDTPGAEIWISKLKWEGLPKFQQMKRIPLYLKSKGQNTQAFLKKFQNFSLYYIMDAGHMVPADNGEMALQMLADIISDQSIIF